MKLIDSFRNPVTRPRAIIWTGTILAVLCMVIVVMFAASSSYWFCAEVCHKVQDDAISAYNRSPHNKVNCLACHIPANDGPIGFTIHKIESLPELPMAIFNTYSLPLNAEDGVALSGYVMPSTQCTQCHDLSKRKVTPSAGIIINHSVHSENNISCTICHNRVAHNESGDWTPVNNDPQTKKLSTKHDDFSTMDGCFRCHRLADDGIAASTPFTASGECKTCHPASFKLKPASHDAANFLSSMHGKLAVVETKRVEEATQEAKSKVIDEKSAKTREGAAVKDVPSIREVNSCYTCHAKKFCEDCHGGVVMPHPEGFLNTHKTEATEHLAACTSCHGVQGCTTCHHSDTNVPGYTYDTKKSWLSQHNIAAGKAGTASCFKCHQSTYCAHCHVTGLVN
ncbi:MAG: hypothetical protein JJE36_00935 [Coriobacteriia bacterium]|nr:hypothetical protein [Coriobacteriia bacterium]